MGAEVARRYRGFRATATWDPGSCGDYSQVNTTVSVGGAAVGDAVAVGFTTALTAGSGNLFVLGEVTSANTVTVKLHNMSGGTVDLGSGTLSVVVLH